MRPSSFDNDACYIFEARTISRESRLLTEYILLHSYTYLFYYPAPLQCISFVSQQHKRLLAYAP